MRHKYPAFGTIPLQHPAELWGRLELVRYLFSMRTNPELSYPSGRPPQDMAYSDSAINNKKAGAARHPEGADPEAGE